jgi:hypothetical protein
MTIILDGRETPCAEFAPVPGVWVRDVRGARRPLFQAMLTGLEVAYVLVTPLDGRSFVSVDRGHTFIAGSERRADRRRRVGGRDHDGQLALELNGA